MAGKGGIVTDTNKIPKSGIAIASLILGVVSFIPLVGVLLGIIAIVLGIVAISQINKQGLGGKGLAKIGIILGILGIFFGLKAIRYIQGKSVIILGIIVIILVGVMYIFGITSCVT